MKHTNDIIRMAREAGFTNPERFETDDENLRGILEDFWVNLERFAALVRADEREADALLCEQLGAEGYGSLAIAAAIRLRGKT
jgi:hypothetical protein